jgi:hypothetical protein
MRQHPQVLSPETMAILAGSVNPNMAKNEQAGNPLEASTDTRNGSSARAEDRRARLLPHLLMA